MDIFLSTVNDFQGLTVVTKNVAVDGTDVLDPRDRFYIKFSKDLKSIRVSVLIRLRAFSVSAVQSISTTLEKRFTESCFNASVLTLRRRNIKIV